MQILLSTKLLQRWFSVTISCGVGFILFCIIFSYNQPRSGKQYEDGMRYYPGEYLKNVSPNPLNKSYCIFNLKFPNFSKIHGTPEKNQGSAYRVIYNILEANSPQVAKPSVTYATHLTYEFVDYLVELVRYWDGPVSVAVFLPNGDPNPVLEKIVHFCYCVPDMSKVSLHFVFPEKIGIRNRTAQINKVPFLKCDIPTSVLKENPSNTYAQKGDSWYPVNVCRNVARSASLAEYVMVSDIELLPSKDISANFLAMLKSNKGGSPDSCKHVVYVVPIFEIESTESIPRTKMQLLDLVNKGKAVYFHQHTCIHCQKFPGLSLWLENGPANGMKPFLTTKREMPYHRWEPIYIGTKNEPFYNEALSWEGFQDKMLQMLEMCLMNYSLIILDSAFLVHWPGIKKNKTPREPWRMKYVKENQKHYDAIVSNISASYPPNKKCRDID